MADKYNIDAADSLANEALHLSISEAVPKYEQIIATFPTAAKYWKQYVEAHMAVNNDDATKQLFSRCLLTCLHIPLWRCYIRFIRKVNDRKAAEGQEETRKAYDFMLAYVGADIASGPAWIEYIAFLKSLPVLNPQDESQRMTSLRKAYQKAIVTPTHHIEQLWKDYENFENSVGRALAKGLVSEYQPKYNSAKAVYRELKKFVDEIDWNTLAVPPTGTYKEEVQWMAWKRFIAFEKGNPQRIDNVSSNKRIVYAYEQCLMHLYHYPDLWYDFAMWHSKCGSVDAAVKVFQRALKALPDSEMLWYAYAELEESHGAIQPAKKIYENLLGDGVNPTALAHIHYIRFLRRTEGVEAARKYFLDARKFPNCMYQVYVAYATMAFCLDKDPKIAHNIFEAGLKRFMHEPGYILEYADFLSRLNDDRNIRALFERALSSLPPEESVEVWKRFTQFEQTYGDLASMLKVEHRRKEALSRTGDEVGSALECSLQDVVSRYSFMDLWPCSSKDLDHLSRQEWLSKNVNKKVEPNGASSTDKISSGLTTTSNPAGKIIFPDTSRMIIYDPTSQKTPATGPSPSTTTPGLPSVSSTLPIPQVAMVDGGVINKISKPIPPALAMFIANLPITDGPCPNVDIVLSILMQSTIPVPVPPANQTGKSGLPPGPVPRPTKIGGRPGKRKDIEEDESASVQSAPLPRDVFRIRHSQKAARGGVPSQRGAGASSQTNSASCGSAFSGDLSGSTG